MHKKLLIINLIIFIIIAIIAFAIGFFVLTEVKVTEAAGDDTPPVITNVKISDVTATSSVITWETDEFSDSLVNYNIRQNYGLIRDPNADKKTHKIILDDLQPDTVYYYRLISSDEYGNQGISSDFTFQTEAEKDVIPPSGEEEDQDYEMNEGNTKDSLEQLKDRIKENLLKTLQEGTDEKLLQEVLDAIEDAKNKEALEQVDVLLQQKVEEEEQVDDEMLQKIVQLLKELIGDEIYETLQQKSVGEGDLDGPAKEYEFISFEEVVQTIQNIMDQEQLNAIMSEVKDQAEEVVQPPTIILDYADVQVGTDWAIITWKTDKESNSMVALSTAANYDEADANPYTWNEGFPEEYVVDHVVEINGLTPATEYHFQVSSQSSIGLTGRSEDKTFKTKSVQPEIYNLHLSKIEEEAATLRWTTNVPCSSIVEYTNLDLNETKLEGNSSFLTVHTIRLTNLVFDTYYSAIVKVESEDGEKAESAAITFITIKDEYPPEISKVTTESTLFPGTDNKIQTIASWETDEPSVCQIFYHPGLMFVDEPLQQPKEEELTVKHVQVITNFLPSTVYKFWIICNDEAENEAKSDDFTMLTPTQEESIIDIIIKNFESSFGWLKKLQM